MRQDERQILMIFYTNMRGFKGLKNVPYLFAIEKWYHFEDKEEDEDEL